MPASLTTSIIGFGAVLTSVNAFAGSAVAAGGVLVEVLVRMAQAPVDPDA